MKTGYGLGRMGNWLARRVMRTLGRRGEEGTALTEFAITLPLLMIVLMGTASFSMALYFLQQIGNATSTAAQLLGAEQGLITDPCATVVTSVTNSLPNLSASKLTYTVVITDSSGTPTTFGPTTGSSFSCTSGAADMAPNEPVTVTVSYAYSWFPIPRFSWLPGFTFVPSGTLTSSETALAE
jgi:Flp pilus assembly protein TadG